MRSSPVIVHEPSITRLAVTSFILHVALLFLLVIPFRSGEREFRSYSVNLVAPPPAPPLPKEKAALAREERATKRVPPKKKIVKKKEAPLKRELPPKEAVKKKPVPDEDTSQKTSEKIAKEIERLRAMKALSKRKEDIEKKHDIEVIRKRVSDNQVTTGGAPGQGENGDLTSYYALITRKIWSEWIYPDIDTEGLEVIISIRIGSDGRVLSHKIEKTSGNGLFDSSALKAISKASPLPPPHVEMEVGVRFYL